MRTVQLTALEFCIELLNQTMQQRETEMALVCALAVLGVRPTGKGFRDEQTFPSILSSIIKVAHFMVVLQAERLTGHIGEEEWAAMDSPCTFDDSGYESEQMQRPKQRRATRSSYRWVIKMMDSFMVRGTASPMQWMLDLRAYGMKISFSTTSEGHVGWRNGDVLEYKDIHFSMAQFRGMVDQLRRTTRKQLMEIMFAADEQDVPAVPWKDLFDDPSNDSDGWSFVDDTRTPWPVDGRRWLFERIQGRPECRQRFVSEQTANGVNEAKLRDWMKTIDDFRGQLLALMHITGGQPARGPEILSVRHSNTVQGRFRNLFIEDGMVVFVTQYHKGEQYKADVKIIHRYLPREVGELVVWYRWLVVPFVQRMKSWLWSDSPVSDHIWGPGIDGRQWTTERMKRHLQRATEAGLGHKINVAAYRHIAIAISRRWVRSSSAFTNEETIEDGDEIADDQATHSPFTAGAIYAREMQELPGSTASRRQQFRTASVDWHRFLGFESSIKDEVRKGIKRAADPFEAHSKRARIEREQRVRHMNIAEEMAWMMGQDVSLRSAQGEALSAIKNGEGKIVVVMPTGAGKSILFMLPASVGVGGVTVVVVPFVTLRHDMKGRSEKAGVPVGEWDGKRSMDGKSIVFVTPEAAIREGFQTFLRRLRQTERLDRIVIDECHTMLGEQGGFREGLTRLGSLVSAHTQMLLLTATLPPCDEPQLVSRMFWRPGEVRMIRASTVRPNIEYSVVQGCREFQQQMGQLAEFIQPIVEAGGKAVVICNDIERIKSIVEAAPFPCEPFHKKVDEHIRNETFEAFRAGRTPVLVATSVFGTGIDIPDVRLIIHITEPDNMREYGQESGRCGRDGKPSRAVIVRQSRPRDARVRVYTDEGGCRRIKLDGYLDGDTTRTRCREGEVECDWCQAQGSQGRAPPPGFAPTAVMVPASAQMAYGTPPETQRSFACPSSPRSQSRSQPQPESSLSLSSSSSTAYRRLERMERGRMQPDERRLEQSQDRRIWHEDLRERLNRWKNVCVICHSRGKNNAHTINRCRLEDSMKAERERAHVQRTIKFPQSHVCFKCGVPRLMCERWSSDGRARVHDEDGKGVGCQFYGVLLGVTYGVKHAYPEVWKRWSDKAKGDAQWKGNMVEFLGSSIEGDEGLGCQVGQAFMYCTEDI
jgi:superfamily II DNA or RNA helicase